MNDQTKKNWWRTRERLEVLQRLEGYAADFYRSIPRIARKNTFSALLRHESRRDNQIAKLEAKIKQIDQRFWDQVQKRSSLINDSFEIVKNRTRIEKPNLWQKFFK